MNPISERLLKGSIGELLVQLLLLQYGVQAAPPIKDSGNDLIAIRGQTFKAIQVKTRSTEARRFEVPQNRLYHILACVLVEGEGDRLHLDSCKVYLLDEDAIGQRKSISVNRLTDYEISQAIIDHLFPPP